MSFERPLLKRLLGRLLEPRLKIQILMGARQVGKTTLSLQALKKILFPSRYEIAESGMTVSWLDQQWASARALARTCASGAVLVIDEVQKIDNWSERVKRLWDEDTAGAVPLKIVLLGSSSLLLHRGLTESMAGRYEMIPVSHWSFTECAEAFGMTLEEFIYFGGYPGSLIYRHDEERFLAYIQDAIIEPVVTRDILSQFIVHKPALLRELFRLGCAYSGQILSFNKMLGQLHDAGNTTTLSHYLQLLDQAGVLKGLDKFSHHKLRQRQSSPKLQVYNTALTTAVLKTGFELARQDPKIWGRFVENAVGASLLMDSNREVFYWREQNDEVDFVIRLQGQVVALEVKSGTRRTSLPGVEKFSQAFSPKATLLVGSGGIPLDQFFRTPLTHFLP